MGKEQIMEIVVIKESLFVSWIKDLFTFGLLFGLWYLNHTFLDSGWMIDFIVAFLVFMGALSFRNKKLTIEEAKKELDRLSIKDLKNNLK